MDPTGLTDIDLLVLQLETGFISNDDGRLVRSNSPDNRIPPRMYLVGCRSGNLVRFRQDIDSALAETLQQLVLEEPPLYDVDRPPLHTQEYLRLLGDEAAPASVRTGLAWTFPEKLEYVSDARLIHSGSLEGEQLLARLTREGMPAGVVDLGFKSLDDFWPPWCVALHGEEIASIAEAARLGPAGAETGISTVRHLRKRGYATAAVAGWAHSASLRGRTLFYSTDASNTSSRHVAERLNLRYLGATFSIM